MGSAWSSEPAAEPPASKRGRTSSSTIVIHGRNATVGVRADDPGRRPTNKRHSEHGRDDLPAITTDEATSLLRLSVTHAGRTYWGLMAVQYVRGAFLTHLSRYARTCINHNDDVLPPTKDKLITMLAEYVFLYGLSSSSLGTVYSGAKMAITIGLGEEWISDKEDAECRAYIRFLEKNKPRDVQFTEELRRTDLAIIKAHLDTRLRASELFAWNNWCLLVLGNQTGMRADEMLNGNLLWSQIELVAASSTTGPGGAKIHQPLRKAAKSSIDAREAHTYIARRDDAFDAVAALEKLAAITGAKIGVSKSPVFMHVNEKGQRTFEKLTTDTFIRHLRENILTPAGFENVDRYAGHSMRAGAATDMLADGHDWETVARICGWRSDSAMRRYIRLYEENIRLLAEKNKEIAARKRR